MLPTPPLPGPAARLHLARPGSFIDMHGQAVDLPPALLAALAASYDPARYAAPLVIGHPKINGPAFGHLASVEVTADGLFGIPADVDPFFADAVRSQKYPQRSLSFWPADHPSSPTPGQPYIRHLGVLGAVPPAIPGLRGADLAAADEAVTQIDFTAPASASASPPEDPSMPDLDPVALAAQVADLAAKTQQLADREAALAAREATAAAHAAALAKAQEISFCDGLASEARIRPADIAPLAEALLLLNEQSAAPCFAAAESDTPQTPGAWLRGWLATLPPLVELGSVATTGRYQPPAPQDDRAVAQRARHYQRQMGEAGTPISFTAAVEAVEANTDRSTS